MELFYRLGKFFELSYKIKSAPLRLRTQHLTHIYALGIMSVKEKHCSECGYYFIQIDELHFKV